MEPIGSLGRLRRVDVARRSLLTAGCEGWRNDGRCTGPTGERLAHPHPECLETLYHDRLAAVDGRAAST